MNSWTLDIPAGLFFVDFAWMGLLLILATYLRSRVGLLQRYLIPANLLAGAIGLLIGMNGMEWIDLNSDRLGTYVYHLLALLFIALGLRAPKKRLGMSSVKFSLIFLAVYLIQAIIGLSVAFILFYTILPDLFVGIGLLPPLAFGMNPGIAYSIGGNWEQFGFESGGIVGLTFAAFGFLVAYTVGIWLVRRGIKKGWATYIGTDMSLSEDIRTGIIRAPKPNTRERITTSPESIESLTFHIGMIGLVYILTYLLMKGMEAGLVMIDAGNEITTLWSFHFIFAAILALGVRKFMDLARISKVVDDMTMTRCSNLFMDFMIVASVAAISFQVILAYWVPILFITILVSLATWIVIQYLTSDAFEEYRFERFASIFGNLTGTLQSGLVLLRILDPNMKSPASFNLVYGSGLALVFGFPLLIVINAPVHYFTDLVQGFWVVLGVMILYLFLIMIAWNYLRKART